MEIIEKPFGKRKHNNEIVPLFTCDNGNGLQITLLPLGATLVQVYMPDRNGNVGPLCLGFTNLAGYEGPHPSFGSTVGRFCNRIAQATFSLDGQQHTLVRNAGIHHIHGGPQGLGRQLWTAEPFQNADALGVTFWIDSPAGEMGYPGRLKVEARYTVFRDNRLNIAFSAITDAPTHLNLTNHAYWNLAHDLDKTIHAHQLKLDANHILAIDADTIPTGELLPIAGSAFDFSLTHPLGNKLAALSGSDKGFDHCYTRLQPDQPPHLAQAPYAELRHPGSGRCLSVQGTQPGLQLYTSQFLSGNCTDGYYPAFSGVCLEPQGFPNAPNIGHFPSTRLNPGQNFSAEINYEFWLE